MTIKKLKFKIMCEAMTWLFHHWVAFGGKYFARHFEMSTRDADSGKEEDNLVDTITFYLRR